MSSALDASLYVGKINLDGDDVTFLQALFFEARFVSQAFGHQLKSGMHSKLDINTYTPTLCVSGRASYKNQGVQTHFKVCKVTPKIRIFGFYCIFM